MHYQTTALHQDFMFFLLECEDPVLALFQKHGQMVANAIYCAVLREKLKPALRSKIKFFKKCKKNSLAAP